MKRLYNVAFLLSAAALGCSADQGTLPPADGANPSPDLLVVGDGPGGTPADMTMTQGGYPPGPYGNTVGATFPLLVWEGYRDDAADAVATSKTYGAYSMDDVRKSGRAYAMVHISDFI
jgi:hypothetical protein